MKKPLNNQLLLRILYVEKTFYILAILALIICLRLYFKNLNGKWDNILADFIVVLTSAIFFRLFWSLFDETKKEVEREKTVEAIGSIIKGMGICAMENGYKTLEKKIKKAKKINVMGHVNAQNINQGLRNTIDEYFNSYASRLKKREKLIYRRIVPTTVFSNTLQHLHNIFEAGEQFKHHSIEVIFVNEFLQAFTYITIDTDLLLLLPNYPDGKDNTPSERVFISYNKEIVNDINKHFEKVWSTELKENEHSLVKNAAQFSNAINFFDQNTENIKKIKDAMLFHSAHNNLSCNHFTSDLSNTALRFTQLKKNEFVIDRELANGSLIKMLGMYMNQMKENDIYETITFQEFWQDTSAMSNKKYEFINSNKNLLHKGIRIERILIVNDALIVPHLSDLIEQVKGKLNESNIKIWYDRYTYYTGLLNTIRMNIDLCKEYHNYAFRIFFAKKYGVFSLGAYNYAAILTDGKKDDIILFKPVPEKPGEATSLVVYSKSHPVFSEKTYLSKYTDQERLKREIEHFWKVQDLEDRHSEYLFQIDKDFFSDEKNQIRILGKILSRKT